MGFLLGAYGKLMAGKRQRTLQARMMAVQSRLRRATRDIEQMEKYWARVEKDNKNAMSMAMQFTNIGIQDNLQKSVFKDIASRIGTDTANQKGIDLNKFINGDFAQLSKLGSDDLKLYTEMFNTQKTQATQFQQFMQTAMQQQMSMQENIIEAQKEAQLQPLKDLEDDLMLEQEMLKTQIQLAEEDKKACEEMEKAGVKSFAPQYTGQG